MTLHCGTLSFPDDPSADLDGVRSLFDDCPGGVSDESPSADHLASIYEEVQQETDQILSIHTSASLCATVGNARTASQQFLGRCNVQVIDSQTISFGLGLLVEAGWEAAAREASLEDIVRIVRGMIPRLYSVFFLDDMTYLERNGLVSRSQAILGNMLGVIPFLTMEEGRIIPMEKVRSRSRAMEKLVEFVSEFSSVERMALLISSTSPTEESRLAAERIEAVHPHTPMTITGYGPSLATFVGVNALGVVVLEAEEEL
jgi:DegV family protein with EDD domain